MAKKFIRVQDSKGKSKNSLHDKDIKRIQQNDMAEQSTLGGKLMGWLFIKFFKLIILIVCLPYNIYKMCTKNKDSKVVEKEAKPESKKTTPKK